MIHQYLGILIFLLVMIPVMTIVVPLVFVFCLLHPWMFLAIPGAIMTWAAVSDHRDKSGWN
jgi:hypothetical protein